jgi:hypothetical protein
MSPKFCSTWAVPVVYVGEADRSAIFSRNAGKNGKTAPGMDAASQGQILSGRAFFSTE